MAPMSRPPFPSTHPRAHAGVVALLLVLALSGPVVATFDDTAADRAALTQGLLVRGPPAHE